MVTRLVLPMLMSAFGFCLASVAFSLCCDFSPAGCASEDYTGSASRPQAPCYPSSCTSGRPHLHHFHHGRQQVRALGRLASVKLHLVQLYSNKHLFEANASWCSDCYQGTCRVLQSTSLAEDFWDLVDVDSFGSKGELISCALGAVKLGGLVYLTSTDGLSAGGRTSLPIAHISNPRSAQKLSE